MNFQTALPGNTAVMASRSEQVLREGTAADVRLYVDADLLLELWDDLVLPVPVRQAWAAWFRAHRHLDLRCCPNCNKRSPD